MISWEGGEEPMKTVVVFVSLLSLEEYKEA